MNHLPPLKKSLGQHFLHDQNIVHKIVKLVDPKPGENLIEIGPGAGALTVKILPLVDQLFAIEIDQVLAPILKKNTQHSSKLQLYVQDILTTDLANFNSPFRLVGNLPYNISTPIFFHLIKYIHLIQDMHFMIQKDVAQRIIAKPGTKTYGRLSVVLQYYFDIIHLFDIGKNSFIPPPKVTSSLIRLVPCSHFVTKAVDQNRFSEIVKAAFQKRRKIIANSLKGYLLISQLAKLGIDPQARPEQLRVDDFVSLSNESLNKV